MIVLLSLGMSPVKAFLSLSIKLFGSSFYSACALLLTFLVGAHKTSRPLLDKMIWKSLSPLVNLNLATCLPASGSGVAWGQAGTKG